MKNLSSIEARPLLAGSLQGRVGGDLGAPPFADSTGGSSQAHGELATDAANGASRAASGRAVRSRTSRGTAGAPADSTGDSSATRAEYLLDHAQALALPGVAASTRNHYQSFLDSTGGNSQAASERALDAEDAATNHRLAVATASAAH